MVAEIALTLVMGVWTLCSPEAMAALDSPEMPDIYAHEAFKSYYSTYPAPGFAAAVWMNSVHITAIYVAGGITGPLPLHMLYQNAIGVEQAGAIMADHDMLGMFPSPISPHGLLELICIFIAGTAGLKLFWTVLVSGQRSHTVALAAKGRALTTAVVGLTAALAIAGLIEAFVTPVPIPWPVKVAIGAGALALLRAYTLILGHSAVATGSTGDLEEDEAGYVQLETG